LFISVNVVSTKATKDIKYYKVFAEAIKEDFCSLQGQKIGWEHQDYWIYGSIFSFTDFGAFSSRKYFFII
jgi:hypothetical protein